MPALRGDLGKLRAMRERIARAPITVAYDVAMRAAPAMTALTREAYDAGRTVYGDRRPAGAGGKALTLKRTGDAERGLRFVAVGTIVRVVLAQKYVKYLIGKYQILPNGRLPVAWDEKLRELLAEAKL